ncbi:Ig-like domain-containing protein [Aeromonas veronii]|uniref:Ig-like domain-containing protein n=1 Tax=Aeromonas veronii TaxID=654 RepID=UPI003B9E8992
MKVISRYLSTLALLLVLVQTTGVLAQSAKTLSVQGRAPVATGVTLTGPAVPLVGDTLQGTYGFTDADGDGEKDSEVYWLDNSNSELINTHPSGDTKKFLLTNDHVGKQVRFAVTPATDPAVTDPHQGSEVISSPSAAVQGLPDPTQSTFSVDKTTIVADGVEKAVLTLTLKDSAGMPVAGISDRVSLDYSGIVGTDVITLTEHDRGSGVYEYILTGTKSGVETLTPQLDSAPLITTPSSQQVTLVPNPATAVVAQLVTTTDNQPADGTKSDLLTATVHDVEGNTMQGATVVWSHNSSTATLGVATSVTDSNGQATVTLSNTRAETVAVTAKVQANSGDLGITRDANFALYPVLYKLEVGTNEQPANNKALNTIVATFKDLNGDLLANASVTMQFSSNKGTVAFDHASPWTTTTNATGEVTLSLRDSVSEDVEVTVYAANSALVQKMVSVKFTELMISRFLKPLIATPMKWQDANNYCNGLGYRLPTKAELLALYLEVSPSHGENYALCLDHGWPMDSKCGGTWNDYWSNEVGSSEGKHWAVLMNTGGQTDIVDYGGSQVACIRL